MSVTALWLNIHTLFAKITQYPLIHCNFHLLEVVGRGSETQLQVRENLNVITWRCNVYHATSYQICAVTFVLSL